MKSFFLRKIKDTSLSLTLFIFFSGSCISVASDIFSECGGDFQNYLDRAKNQAQRKGVSEKVIAEVLKFTKFDKTNIW